MTLLCIKLEARNPARRCFRAYEITVGQDLFGAWMVEMNYGRIGSTGRAKIRSFGTPREARVQVHACLGKRATAPRRIGTGYRLCRVMRASAWQDPRLGERLREWFPDAADHSVPEPMVVDLLPGAVGADRGEPGVDLGQ